MILMGCDKDNSYMSYDHQFVRRCYAHRLILAIFLPRYQLQALSAAVLDIYSGPDDMLRQ
jgi:hypothetical protein